MQQIIIKSKVRNDDVQRRGKVPEPDPQVEGHGRHLGEVGEEPEGGVRGRRLRRLEAHQPQFLGSWKEERAAGLPMGRDQHFC